MNKRDSLESLLIKIESLSKRDFGKDFLATWDKSTEELEALLAAAQILRQLYATEKPAGIFPGGIAVSNFRDKSTRTRFSFASAASLLGLEVVDLDEEKTQVTHGETVRETAVMISFLARAIGIRDDIYLGEGHKYISQVAQAVEEAYGEGVLLHRPSVINLQSDLDHPTQTMADLAMLLHHFGGVEQLKGMKVAVTWAYSPSYGKPLSVPQGLIGLLTRFGMEVALAYPEGYELEPETVARAERQAVESGGSFRIYHEMEAAFDQADIVYPKSWAPYHIMQQRTELLHKKDRRGLEELEQQALAENRRHLRWECNRRMMDLTKDGQALYMHCLPADISGVNCEQGEVSEEIFDRYRKETYLQASFKPFVIAAMILLGQKEEPVHVLKKLLQA